MSLPTLVPSEDHLKHICKVGHKAECCSFLVMGGKGFACAKRSAHEGLLRNRREHGDMNAMGDNCSGPPDFTPATEAQA